MAEAEKPGWIKKEDGWKMEIPDGEVKGIDDLVAHADKNPHSGKSVELGALEDFYDSEILYKAYPKLRKVKVVLNGGERTKNTQEEGGYDNEEKTLYVDRGFLDRARNESGSRYGLLAHKMGGERTGPGDSGEQKIKKFLVHEIRHLVQEEQKEFHEGTSEEIEGEKLLAEYKPETDAEIRRRGLKGVDADNFARKYIAEKECRAHSELEV